VRSLGNRPNSLDTGYYNTRTIRRNPGRPNPCGGGVEYFTVTLRVVGGDEEGSLKSKTVKYGRESQGAQTRERLR
jgi:hypothetical protein